jgi:hypothetical protein
MDCLPRDLPASAFSGTQFFSGVSGGCGPTGTWDRDHVWFVCPCQFSALSHLGYHQWSGDIGFNDCRVPENDRNGVSGPSSRQVLANKGKIPWRLIPSAGRHSFSSDRASLPLLGSSKARTPRCLSRHAGVLVWPPCSSMPCPGLGLNTGTLVLLLCT